MMVEEERINTDNEKNLDQNETPQTEDAEMNRDPMDLELDRYHENRKKEIK